MDYDLVVNIDGASSGSTGSLGMGGVIKDMKGQWLHAFSLPVEEGSIESAHYLAVIEALVYILASSINAKTILVETDSHVIMAQMCFKSSPMTDSLKDLIERMKELSSRLSCSLDFRWIAEEENFAARALAYKAANIPIAIVENNCIISLEYAVRSAVDEELASVPEINPQTRDHIDRLNSLGYVSPCELISLMTYGIDKYSRAKTQELLSLIEIRFGAEVRDYMVRALGNIEGIYSKNVLRWAARGLRPELAFRKAAIEIEIKEII